MKVNTLTSLLFLVICTYFTEKKKFLTWNKTLITNMEAFKENIRVTPWNFLSWQQWLKQIRIIYLKKLICCFEEQYVCWINKICVPDFLFAYLCNLFQTFVFPLDDWTFKRTNSFFLRVHTISTLNFLLLCK